MTTAIAIMVNYRALRDCNWHIVRAIRGAVWLALRGLVLVEETSK